MTDNSTPRRIFLGQLALTTAGLAAGTREAGAAVPGPAAGAAATKSGWDDSWTKKLGSSHRFVFDLADQGKAEMVLDQITSVYDDYHTALDTRDQDIHGVLVIRHAAIPLIMNDALWTKYKLGAANPNREAIAAWQARGVTVLACDRALMNRVRNFPRDAGQDEKSVELEVRANVLPGVILQPNGVYAVHRAQDAGCTLFHVG